MLFCPTSLPLTEVIWMFENEGKWSDVSLAISSMCSDAILGNVPSVLSEHDRGLVTEKEQMQALLKPPKVLSILALPASFVKLDCFAAGA